MTLLGLILGIAIVGVVVWLITSYVPMDPKFKQLIVAVAVLILVLFVVSMFADGGSILNARIGHG